MKRLLLLLFFAVSTIVTAQRRTGIQDYGTVANLQAETLVSQQNDKVYVKATKSLFSWDASSTATHDGVKVIKQTSIATGRFLLVGVAQSDLDLKANIASPALTGTPTAPTATAGTSTTQLATTAFVTAADNLKANIASPALTGTPTAPTATAGTNTTQLATTAFVTGAAATLQTAIDARIPLHTITQLRAFTSTDVTAKPRVFVTDTTQQGTFFLDNSDTTTPDNTGTVVVTSNSKRYKRHIDNFVNVKWFGAKGDGTTNDTNALISAFNTKKNIFVPVGTYLINSTIEIHSNVQCEKGAVFKVANSTSDTIFIVKSKKSLSIKGIYINAQGNLDNPTNGINPNIFVIGLRIEGLWNSTIDDFSMLSHGLSTTNIGIDIMSSQLYNLKHGAYAITINSPYIIRGGIGIRTKQTTGDETNPVVEITHLSINDGWIGSQTTYNIHLQNITNVNITNLGTDVINSGAVGYKIQNCNQATILVGEYNAGAGVLADISSCSFIRFLSPRLLTIGTDITGTTNNVSLYTGNSIRLSPTTDTGYWAEMRSDYATEAFNIRGNFGDANLRSILHYSLSNGLRTENKKLLTEDNTVTVTGKTISASSNTITNINNSNWSGTVLSVANGGTGSGSGVGLLSGLTSGYVPRATASNTLGIGSIQDNGSQIGIGTAANASYRLLVSGASYLNGATTLGSDGSNASLYVSSGTAFKITGTNSFYTDFATGGTTGDFIFRASNSFEERFRVTNQGGVILSKFATDPSGQEGMIYFNTTSKIVRVHNGTSWGNL